MVSKWRTHKQVFLQRTDEALGDAVALGLAHEGRRGLDAEEGDLALEVVGHVVRAVVVPEHEAGGHVLADGAEVPAHTLADRFQGLEAVGALVGVDADAFAVAVIDGDEDVGHALGQGDALGHVGAPHDVHGLGGDGAVVRLSGRLRTRCGAKSPFSRISRRTRPGELRIPEKRSRAQILR